MHLEISCSDQFRFFPGVGLPGPHINHRIPRLKINQQKQMPFVGIGGRKIILPHFHSIDIGGIIFTNNIKRGEIQEDILLCLKKMNLTIYLFILF